MTELWGLAHHAGLAGEDFPDYEERRSEEDDRLILRLFDEEAGGRGITPWREFDHPQLGEVELGGMEIKFGLMDPPGPLLSRDLERAVPFKIGAMGTAPRLCVIDSGAEEVAPGVHRVWATIGNDGFLPTYGSERRRTTGPGGALTATISLPDGAELLAGSLPASQELEHMAGRVSQHTGYHLSGCYPNLSRSHVEWLVAAQKSATLEVTFRAEKAGVCRTSVTIGK